MRSVREAVGLVAAVAVVLVGGLFAITEASASPPPSRVLSDARSYVDGSRSLLYKVAATVSAPSSAGADLVRHRDVQGVAHFPGGSVMQITEGPGVHQFVSLTGDPTVWVRAWAAASPPPPAGWVRARDLAAFEAALVKGGDAAAVRTATFADRIVDAQILPALLDSAHGASRHGASVRHVDVTFQPAAVFGTDAGAVGAMTGEIVTDAHDHPTSVAVHVQAAPSTIDVTYTLTWGGQVSVAPPPAQDVVASIG